MPLLGERVSDVIGGIEIMIKRFPEYDNKQPLEKKEHVMGGSRGRLANPTSFHHCLIRSLRKEIKRKIALPLFYHYDPTKNVEMLFEQLTIPHFTNRTNAPEWYPPFQPNYFGGFLNIDEKAQYFVRGGESIVVPPGHIVLMSLDQPYLIPNPPTYKLFLSFRLTTDPIGSSLFPLGECLERFAVPQLADGSYPKVIEKRYINRMEEWSVGTFNESFLELRPYRHGPMKGELYTAPCMLAGNVLRPLIGPTYPSIFYIPPPYTEDDHAVLTAEHFLGGSSSSSPFTESS